MKKKELTQETELELRQAIEEFFQSQKEEHE